MEKEGLALVAIVAAIGLLGLVVTASISVLQQQAGAQSLVGQCATFFRNSSAQFCHTIRKEAVQGSNSDVVSMPSQGFNGGSSSDVVSMPSQGFNGGSSSDVVSMPSQGFNGGH